jgi:hypothetical protein
VTDGVLDQDWLAQARPSRCPRNATLMGLDLNQAPEGACSRDGQVAPRRSPAIFRRPCSVRISERSPVARRHGPGGRTAPPATLLVASDGRLRGQVGFDPAMEATPAVARRRQARAQRRGFAPIGGMEAVSGPARRRPKARGGEPLPHLAGHVARPLGVRRRDRGAHARRHEGRLRDTGGLLPAARPAGPPRSTRSPDPAAAPARGQSRPRLAGASQPTEVRCRRSRLARSGARRICHCGPAPGASPRRRARPARLIRAFPRISNPLP